MNDLLNENELQLMIFILDYFKKATQLKLIGGGVKVKKSTLPGLLITIYETYFSDCACQIHDYYNFKIQNCFQETTDCDSCFCFFFFWLIGDTVLLCFNVSLNFNIELFLFGNVFIFFPKNTVLNDKSKITFCLIS